MANETTPPKAPKAPAGTPAPKAPAAPVGWDAPAPVIGDAPATSGGKSSAKVPLAQVLAYPLAYAIRHPARGKGTAPLSSLTPAHVAAMCRGGRIANREYPTDIPVGLLVYATAHIARQKGATRRGDTLLHAAMAYATYLLPLVSEPEQPSDPYTIRTARVLATAPVPEGFTPAHAHRAMYGESAVYGRVQNG